MGNNKGTAFIIAATFLVGVATMLVFYVIVWLSAGFDPGRSCSCG